MHRNLRKVVGALALTAVAVLGVAACGSSDNGSSAGTTSASAGTSGGGGNAADSDLCSDARELDQITSADTSNMDKATFDKIDALISSVQEKAPEEIKDDLAALAERFASVREIFATYDFDIAKLTSAATADPELAAKLQAKLQAFDNDEFKAAGTRVSAYLEKNCGITAGS